MIEKKKRNRIKVIDEIINKERKTISKEVLQKKIAKLTKVNSSKNIDSDFQYLEIADITISNEDLSKSSFNFSRLTNVIFEHCTLHYCLFQMAELKNVTFTGCLGRSLEFYFTHFSDVKFVDMVINHSSFNFANGSISFNKCQMERAEFPSTALAIVMNKCFAGGVNMSNCLEIELNATETSFYHATINDSTLKGSLRDCNCNGLELKNSNCKELKITNCNFRDAELDGVIGFHQDDFTYDLEDSYLDELFKE